MDKRIQLEHLPRPEIGMPWKVQKYRVIFEEEELGVWKDPECSAARRLLERGLAERDDRLRTYRGEKLCLSGSVGWYADRQVRENDQGMFFVKWKPFPLPSEQGTALDAPEVD